MATTKTHILSDETGQSQLTAQQRIATALEAYNGTIQTRLATAEGDITALGTDLSALSTAEGYDLQALQGTYPGRDLHTALGQPTDAGLWAALHSLAQAKSAGAVRIGDYMDVTPTSSTVNKGAAIRYRVAGIGHNYQFGDTACPWAFWFVPDAPIDMTGSSYAINTSYIYWNTTASNNGNANEKRPYLASNLHAWELGQFLPALPTALQSVLISHRVLLEERYSASGALTDSTGWSWADAGKVFSLSEMEVFGCCVWGTPRWSMGETAQLPLFRDSRYRIKSRVLWWLRSVRSGSSFLVCLVLNHGPAYYHSAAGSSVRPRPCFLVG